MAKQSTQPVHTQATVLALLLGSYLAAALLYFALTPFFPPMESMPGMNLAAGPAMPWWMMAGANAAAIVVVYTPLAYAGLWLARRIGLPGVYAPGTTWQLWVRGPLLVGAIAGVAMIAADWAVRAWLGGSGFPHPPFPLSLLASYTAAVGEEIIFRLFILSLWAAIWLLVLRRWVVEARVWAIWLANGMAALVFALAHTGTALVLFGVSSPWELPGWVLGELLLLNGGVGLLAGAAFVRRGLVGATGIHLGADLVWHVLYGLLP